MEFVFHFFLHQPNHSITTNSVIAIFSFLFLVIFSQIIAPSFVVILLVLSYSPPKEVIFLFLSVMISISTYARMLWWSYPCTKQFVFRREIVQGWLHPALPILLLLVALSLPFFIRHLYSVLSWLYVPLFYHYRDSISSSMSAFQTAVSQIICSFFSQCFLFFLSPLQPERVQVHFTLSLIFHFVWFVLPLFSFFSFYQTFMVIFSFL